MGLFRAVAMIVAIALVAVEGLASPGLATALGEFLSATELRRPALQVLLALFLFAAALQVRSDGGAWLNIRLVMFALAVIVLSMLMTALIGGWVVGKIGFDLTMTHFLLLGLILAPSDPLAIARLMGLAGATPLQAGRAAGEAAWGSLFVLLLYLGLSGSVAGDATPFATMVLQGSASLLLGAVAGAALLFAVGRGMAPGVRAGLSLALITGIAMLAVTAGLSAPIAALVAGLAVALCPARWSADAGGAALVREQLSPPWSRAAEVLVVALLLWLGIELAASSPSLMVVTIAVFLVPVVVIGRVACVHAMVFMLDLREQFTTEATRVMVWGGVRSAPAAALVLMLEPGAQSVMLLTAVFMVLVFSALVQGPLYGITAAIARPIAKEAQAAKAEKPPESDDDSDAGSGPGSGSGR